MFASFEYDNIEVNDLRYGIKFNGQVGSKEVVLCQHHPFPNGCGCGIEEFVVIEFEKDLEEVLIDTDESEAYDLFNVSRSVKLWSEVLNERSNETMYGAYVDKIDFSEIVDIHHCMWDPEGIGSFDFLIGSIEYNNFIKIRRVL